MPFRIISDAETYSSTQSASDFATAAADSYTSQYLSRPDIAANVTSIQSNWPHLTPGATFSLASGGYDGYSPVTQTAALASANRRARKGFGWHTIGDVIGGGAIKLGQAINWATEPAQKTLKPISRGTFAAFNLGLNYVDALAGQAAADVHSHGIVGGAIRSLPNLYAPGITTAPAALRGDFEQTTLAQTQLGSALLNQRDTGTMGLGAGYFPAGPASEAADIRRRTIYQIDGHAPTMGRLLARTISEPGSWQYGLTSGVLDLAKTLYADPANLALTSVSSARAASKLIPRSSPLPLTEDSIGLITGIRRTVYDPAVRDFATLDPRGRAAMSFLTGETSPYRIRQQTGMDLEVAADFARASTPEETLSVFEDHAMTGLLRDKPTPHSLTARWQRSQDEVRLLATYPRDQVVRTEHLTETADKLRAHMVNAKMGGEAISANIDRLALVNPEERGAVVRDTFNDIAARMAGRADSEGKVPGYGRLKLGSQVYTSDRAGRGEIVNLFQRDVSARAEGAATSYPERVARIRYTRNGIDELVERPVDDLSVHLPYTKARAIFRPRGIEEGEVFLRELADNKPTLGAVLDGQLNDLNPAHPYAELTTSEHMFLPNIREARRFFSTYGRLLNNSSLLGASADALDAFRNIWLPLTLLRPAGSIRSLGSEQAFMAAAGHTSLFRHPLTHIATIMGRKGGTTFTGDLFEDHARIRTQMAHAGRGYLDRAVTADSISYAPDHPDFPFKWAEELAGKSTDPLAQRLVGAFEPGEAQTGNILTSSQDYFWNTRVPELKELVDEKAWPAYFTNRAAADKYVEDYASHIQHLTQSDPLLAEVVGRGTIGGSPAFTRTTGNPVLTEDLTSYTRDLTLAGSSPSHIVGDRPLSISTKRGLDRAVTKMFDAVWSYPMRKATLIPLLKEHTWQRGTELLPLMTKDAQSAFLLQAREAGFRRGELRNMAVQALKGSGDLTLEEAQHVSLAHAIDQSKKLLYDLHDRSQFNDIARHFIPFFDAWLYNLRMAGKLTYQHPEALRRFQVTVQGARGNGFFHQDENGVEVFSYHLPEAVMPGGTGMTGSVAGLNLATQSLLPGLGPLVQIPVSKLIPDVPDARYIRSMLLPYGEPSTDIGRTLAPPWMEKVIDGITGTPDGTRTFASSVKDATRHYMSTGDYDPANETSMRTMEDKSLKLAKVITVIRGLAQSVLPSAPKPEWKAYDPSGKLLAQTKMAAMYREMQNNPAIGYDNATAAFITTFGEQNLLLLQPNTIGTSPDTKRALDWSKLNRDIINDYPDAAQYIAPQGGGDAGLPGYSFAIDEGTRRQIPYKEWVSRANDRVGSMIYYNVKGQIGPKPNPAQESYLRQLNAFLKTKFPGYDPESSDPNRSKRTIEQLYKLAESRPDVLSSTPAGKAVLTYLVARDQAQDKASQAGITGWQTAKKTEPIRSYLRGIGSQLARESPDFLTVWDRIFSREVAPRTTAAIRADLATRSQPQTVGA